MRGIHSRFLAAGALALGLAAPALAAPEVVLLGGGGGAADPVAACGDAAASPFEPGRDGRGVSDQQIFLGEAVALCEAALAAAPDSAAVKTWLARTYVLVGRREEAKPLLDSAIEAGNAFAGYLLANVKFAESWLYPPEEGIDLLAWAADDDFAPALSALALRYETGKDLGTDYAAALGLYERAVAQGDGFAAYKLGDFYQYALSVAADPARAMTFYEQALALGEPLGYFGLGQLHEYGVGVPQDYEAAAGFYQQGADAGEKMAQTSLAYLYEQGVGVAQDFDKSFALLTSAATKNWGFAEAALSIHYLYGQGTPVDPGKALRFAQLAVQNDVAYAHGILGYLYSEALGTERNLYLAADHFGQGAAQGDQYSADRLPVAEAELACQTAAGDPHEVKIYAPGVSWDELDPDTAIPACEAAVALNPEEVGDMVWLGRAYAKAERFADAVPLLEQGVTAGNPLAQLIMGDMLLAGAGVDEDPAAGLALFEAAAAQDFGPAQYGLGLAHAAGWGGLAPDPQAALEWFRKARDNDVDEATEQIALLAGGGSGGAVAVDMAGFAREGPRY